MNYNYVIYLFLKIQISYLPWPSPQQRTMRLNFPLPSSTKFLVYLQEWEIRQMYVEKYDALCHNYTVTEEWIYKQFGAFLI